ncbi:hypothetical protein OsI_15368 [Oryza sativa Indica Group]|nr:hypothetical protein OsI_15368 [Oryza sativa Indica Group]
MSAPMLETILIRGCCSLRHLPDVKGLHEPRPIVYCEKDWWDNLEWPRKEGGYDQSLLYKRQSAQYYKKALTKGSILRSNLSTYLYKPISKKYSIDLHG